MRYTHDPKHAKHVWQLRGFWSLGIPGRPYESKKSPWIHKSPSGILFHARGIPYEYLEIPPKNLLWTLGLWARIVGRSSKGFLAVLYIFLSAWFFIKISIFSQMLRWFGPCCVLFGSVQCAAIFLCNVLFWCSVQNIELVCTEQNNAVEPAVLRAWPQLLVSVLQNNKTRHDTTT